jgi:hypothetical protein
MSQIMAFSHLTIVFHAFHCTSTCSFFYVPIVTISLSFIPKSALIAYCVFSTAKVDFASMIILG